MQAPPALVRLRTQRAVELCRHFQPSADALNLLDIADDAGQFLNLLITQRLWHDAALALAHGLQKRSAVWWACLICRGQLQHEQESSISMRELAAIEHAEHWVRDPQEKHRLAAWRAAALAGNRAPAHWVAMAAFWSTGNMTPGSGVATPSPPFLYARAIVSALEFAAARSGRLRDEFFQDAMQRGMSLASGGAGT